MKKIDFPEFFLTLNRSHLDFDPYDVWLSVSVDDRLVDGRRVVGVVGEGHRVRVGEGKGSRQAAGQDREKTLRI